MSVGVHAHTGTIKLHTRSPRPRVTHRVDDGVFELQRAEVRMGDGGVMAAKIARQGCVRPQVLGPVDLTDSTVKPLGVSDFKPRQLEKHPIRHARPEARAISDREVTREGDPSRSLACIRRTERNQLPGEKIGKTPWSTD